MRRVPGVSLPPSPEECGQAVLGGVPVRFGLPVHITRGSEHWSLNLAAAQRGESDPWLVCAEGLHGEIVLASSHDRSAHLAGMLVGANDLAPLESAMRAAPEPGDEHDELADGMRLAAGRQAMRIGDEMLRARTLDAIDGWSAVLGRLIDDDLRHGQLYEPSDESLTCRLLVVVCPSTGRRYVSRVPAEMLTARDARLWRLHGIDPEVES